MVVAEKPTIVEVPPLHVDGVEANRCLVNVERHVAMHGGRAVFGWRVSDLGSGSPIAEHCHHVVWESPEGDLFDITPQLVDRHGETLYAVLTAICFLPDPEADFLNIGSAEEPVRVARPNRFVPHSDDIRIWEMCEYLRCADQKFYTGDFSGGRYYNQKANKIAHKHGLHFQEPDEYLLQEAGYQLGAVYAVLESPSA